MPRISEVLERESRSVDLEQGDFERLLDRRERRQRNRRIRAGVVGVLVALAAGFVLVRSLTSDGVPADQPVEPAPAALSGPLAYDLRGQIHVAGLDGSNAVAITDVVAIDDECPDEVRTFAPSWSPDGRYLAFSRFTDCFDPTRHDTVIAIVIADLQGNVVDSFRVSVGYPQGIAWSPDSTRVAAWDEYGWGARGVGTFTMGVYGIDGTSETFPMPAGWGPSWNSDPIWTPDGASLIVGELEIPVDGGAPREIPFHGTFQDPSGGVWTGALVYSPDGSQMAYGTPQGLMVARADGSDPRAVSDDGAHTAAWSPNGELIAVASATPGTDQFTRVPGHGAHEQWPDRLRIVDVATGSTTLLSGGEGMWLEVIGFSPEGDRVVFGEHRQVEGQPEGTFLDSIWSIGIDGSDPRQIVVGTSSGALRPT
jgi:DNA-binding beta-propeller fold protein YncE